MPHIHLDLPRESLTDVKIEEVLARLVETLSKAESVNPASVKAYVSTRDFFRVGEGHTPWFVHCEISLLKGRPLELRQKIGREIRRVLLLYWGNSSYTCTVEVREMDPETYLK